MLAVYCFSFFPLFFIFFTEHIFRTCSSRLATAVMSSIKTCKDNIASVPCSGPVAHTVVLTTEPARAAYLGNI